MRVQFKYLGLVQGFTNQVHGDIPWARVPASGSLESALFERAITQTSRWKVHFSPRGPWKMHFSPRITRKHARAADSVWSGYNFVKPCLSAGGFQEVKALCAALKERDQHLSALESKFVTVRQLLTRAKRLLQQKHEDCEGRICSNGHNESECLYKQKTQFVRDAKLQAIKERSAWKARVTRRPPVRRP